MRFEEVQNSQLGARYAISREPKILQERRLHHDASRDQFCTREAQSFRRQRQVMMGGRSQPFPSFCLAKSPNLSIPTQQTKWPMHLKTNCFHEMQVAPCAVRRMILARIAFAPDLLSRSRCGSRLHPCDHDSDMRQTQAISWQRDVAKLSDDRMVTDTFLTFL